MTEEEERERGDCQQRIQRHSCSSAASQWSDFAASMQHKKLTRQESSSSRNSLACEILEGYLDNYTTGTPTTEYDPIQFWKEQQSVSLRAVLYFVPKCTAVSNVTKNEKIKKVPAHF